MAVAYTWAARVMVISFEMVAPGLLGLWLDQRLGTKVLFLTLGLVLGMTIGMMHLLRIAKMTPSKTKKSSNMEKPKDAP